jgi:hypothetical protein
MDSLIDYKDIVDEVIKIDNRLYKLYLERNGRRDLNDYICRGY